MFKIEKKITDHLGRTVVKGQKIKEHLPEAVLPGLLSAAGDQDLKWEQAMEESTMFIDSNGHCSIVHQVGEWSFSGTLLLTFNLDPKCGHRISYPKKWLHLEHYLKNPKYCN